MTSGHTLVVTPTFNEAGNIGQLIEGVLGLPGALDLLVVDDSSPDGTADVVRAAIEQHPGQVRLLSRPARSGLGTAYIDGFGTALDAGYDRVVQMDADGSHDPAHIPVMLAALDNSADVAVGSRYIQGGSADGLGTVWRKVLSRAANLYARSVTRVPVSDLTGGFKAYRAGMLARVDWASLDVSGFGFQVVSMCALLDVGARLAEVPIRFQPRASGESKMGVGIMAEGLRVTWGCRPGRRNPSGTLVGAA